MSNLLLTAKTGEAIIQMSNRILVVDDESDICFVLQSVLGGNGFVVDSYDDPHIALKKFKADLYNLVILDIKMPDLNSLSKIAERV